MKARVAGYISAKAKKAIHDELELEWKKMEARKKREMAERVLKIFLCVLVEQYGFGKKRGREFYERCGKMLSGSAAVGKGQRDDDVCTAAHCHFCSRIGIGDGKLTALGELLTHDTKNNVGTAVTARHGDLVQMPGVQRIVFTDDRDGTLRCGAFHGELLF